MNYRGKTTDSKESFTEVVAEEIMRNNIFNLMSRIEESKRTKYKVLSHDGISDTAESYRNEEIFCKKLFLLSKNEKKSFDEIGKILGYQVPLKNSRSDIGVGKIKLI